MPQSDVVSNDVISKLAEVDPVFREVVSALYGDAVDPREAFDIAKAEKGHTKEIPEWQRKVALATNAAGVVAGPAAIYGAYRAHKTGEGGMPRAALRHAAKGKPNSTAAKTLKLLSGKGGTKAKLAAAAAGGAGVGLQAANWAGDAIAAQAMTKPKKSEQVKKVFDEGLAQIVAARRTGVIDSEQAIEMAVTLAKRLEAELEEISKWNPPGVVRAVRDAVTVQGKPFAVAPTQRAKNAGRKLKMLNPVARANDRARQAVAAANNATEGKKFVLRGALAGGAVVGAGGGAAYGTKRGRKQVLSGAVVKSEDEVDYGFTGEISKVDADKRLAFGWCSLSEIDGEPVVDLQNDWAPIEEIEKSAYAYVIESRKGGDMHARDGDAPLHTADLVESMIVTPEKLEQMGLSKEVAKSVPTGWWVGFKVNDDTQWQRVKNGERTGFSIHGKGSRLSKSLDELRKNRDAVPA